MTTEMWPESFHVGEWRVRPSLDRVENCGRIVHIDPRPMSVLVHLASRAGQVVSADDLIDAVWTGRYISDNPVYKSIAKLRKALGDDAHEPRFIETIAKRGYRLIATTDFQVCCVAADHASTVPAGAQSAAESHSAPTKAQVVDPAVTDEDLWSELRRRRVITTIRIYVVAVVFAVIALVVAMPAFDLPGWLLNVLAAIAIAGLPLVALLAWIFDIERT